MFIPDSFGCEKKFYSRKEHSFKGTIVVPYDEKHVYYAGHEDLNNMFFPVSYFTYEHKRHREDLDITHFLSYKKKELNKHIKDNNFYSTEDIKNLFIPDIDIKDIDSYVKNYPYIMYFHGFDDGHYFFRFKSKEERESFFQTISNLSSADEIFYYEKENLVLFRDN